MLPFRVKQQKMIVKTGKFSVLVGMRRSTKQQSGEFQVRAESLWLNSQIKCVAAAHNYKIRKNASVQMKRHANSRSKQWQFTQVTLYDTYGSGGGAGAAVEFHMDDNVHAVGNSTVTTKQQLPRMSMSDYVGQAHIIQLDATVYAV